MSRLGNLALSRLEEAEWRRGLNGEGAGPVPKHLLDDRRRSKVLPLSPEAKADRLRQQKRAAEERRRARRVAGDSLPQRRGAPRLIPPPPCPECAAPCPKARGVRAGCRRWHCRSCGHNWTVALDPPAAEAPTAAVAPRDSLRSAVEKENALRKVLLTTGIDHPPVGDAILQMMEWESRALCREAAAFRFATELAEQRTLSPHEEALLERSRTDPSADVQALVAIVERLRWKRPEPTGGVN